MTDLTIVTPLIRASDLVAVDMDGDLVMMSIDNGEYYGVEGVGPRVWELLEQPVTVEQIIATITAEFDVEENGCRKDMLDFVRQLLDMRLVNRVEKRVP